MSTLTAAAVLPWLSGVAIRHRSDRAASLQRRPLAAQTQSRIQALMSQQRRRGGPSLLLSSPQKPESRYLYDLTTEESGGSLELNRELHLPDLADHSLIGCSQGFLLSVDEDGEMFVTDPLTGARLSVPSTASLPGMAGVLLDPSNNVMNYAYCINYQKNEFEPPKFESLLHEDLTRQGTGRSTTLRSFPHYRDWHNEFEFLTTHWMQYANFGRAIISPCLGILAVVHGNSQPSQRACDTGHIAFARLGSSSSSWTALRAPSNSFCDIIFHRGRLHAIYDDGTLFIFDLDSSPNGPPAFRSTSGPLVYEDRFLNVSLVESPDGEELFLVGWGSSTFFDANPDTFKVFMLDKRSYKWRRVRHIGGLAMFLGCNHCFSLSPFDFPCLRFSHVYFTHATQPDEREPYELVETGVYRMRDGHLEEAIRWDASPPNLRWQDPIWFMPAARHSNNCHAL